MRDPVPAEPSAAPAPNPVTKRRHERERFNQIYAPVILTAYGLAMGLVVAVILFTRSLEGQLSIVADVLLICFTLLPCLVAILVLFFFMAFLAFGVHRLNVWVPPIFARAQAAVNRLGDAVRRAMAALARPVVDLNARLAHGRRFAAGLRSFLTLISYKETNTDERE